jgi:hypothetical protein
MVARRLPAQPAPDPRHQEITRPGDVVPPHVENAARGQRRPRLLGVGRHVEAEHLARAERHARVPLGRQVQPVGVPGPAVLHTAQGPQVEHRAAVPVGDGPDVSVVGGDLAAQVLEHGHATGVESGRHHDRAGHRGELDQGPLEALGHLVGVGAGPDDVVAPGAERDEVRGHGDGPRNLVRHDLVEELSAYGEIGVLEVALGPAVGEQDGEPVGPADERPVGAGIPHALGEAVPHRYVRPDHCSAVTLRIVCHSGP